MISFDNFRTLNPESSDLTHELVYANESQRSAFSSFTSVWMGFNGWMECVTEADYDAEMIAELSGHARLSTAYIDLMAQLPNFQNSVHEFASMWPVVNVRDARRKLGRDAFWGLSPEDFMEAVIRNSVKLQPAGWLQDEAPTWPQLLRTIYAIRCNLFHGSKSPLNFRDHKLVVAKDQILRMFIEHSRCFEWND